MPIFVEETITGGIFMSITLQELFRQTKNTYHLRILAGKDVMDRPVKRLYYMEDMNVSSWARQEELIITTGKNFQDEKSLTKFISTLRTYSPTGILINIGEYIPKVPASVIEYCNQIHMPLLTFPWEIYLQDIMQEFTNLIYQSDLKENNLSQALLSAIFLPDKPEEYDDCLKRYGFGHYTRFLVATLQISWKENAFAMNIFKKNLNTQKSQSFLLETTDQWILVFYEKNIKWVENHLKEALNNFTKYFPESKYHVGIGHLVQNYSELYDSYQKACLCLQLCQKCQQSFLIFDQLGLSGLLLSCDLKLLRHYYSTTLEALEQYDKENHTDYMITLELYFKYHGNLTKVAKELYIHKNTVNYRIKKIEEFLHTNFNDWKEITKYQTAFYIRSLLK